MDISAEETQQWAELGSELRNQGFTPGQVRDRVLAEMPHQQSGLMSAASASLAKPVTWKSILIVVGAAIGVGVFFYLVWKAFDLKSVFAKKPDNFVDPAELAAAPV